MVIGKQKEIEKIAKISLQLRPRLVTVAVILNPLLTTSFNLILYICEKWEGRKGGRRGGRKRDRKSRIRKNVQVYRWKSLVPLVALPSDLTLHKPFTMATSTPNPPPLQFPSHIHPRVWLITAISSPIGIALARQLLTHGDCIVGGIKSKTLERDDEMFWEEISKGPWKNNCKIVVLDERCETSLKTKFIT